MTRPCSSTAARTRCRSPARSATSPSTRRAATSSCQTPTSTCSTSGRARRPERVSRNTPIAVGSLPWGMAISNNPDTLLVANSGGTNISRVFIGSTSAPSHARGSPAPHPHARHVPVLHHGPRSDPNHRNKIRMTVEGPISYSDRPQYIAQSKGGRMFYSTRPTTAAPAGTLRWLDPSLPVPDPRQIWQYGSIQAPDGAYALFNVDSIAIAHDSPPNDHAHHLGSPVRPGVGHDRRHRHDPVIAVAAAVAGGSDAELVAGSTSPRSRSTTRTSSRRRATGTGSPSVKATPPAPVASSWWPTASGAVPNFFSPLVTISGSHRQRVRAELRYRARQDRSHGRVARLRSRTSRQSAIRSISDCRASTTRSTTAPASRSIRCANGVLTSQDQRLAFVGSASGNIEVVDIAYYIRRARLQLKNSDLRAAPRVVADAWRRAGRDPQDLRRQPARTRRHRSHGDGHQAGTVIAGGPRGDARSRRRRVGR